MHRRFAFALWLVTLAGASAQELAPVTTLHAGPLVRPGPAIAVALRSAAEARDLVARLPMSLTAEVALGEVDWRRSLVIALSGDEGLSVERVTTEPGPGIVRVVAHRPPLAGPVTELLLVRVDLPAGGLVGGLAPRDPSTKWLAQLEVAERALPEEPAPPRVRWRISLVGAPRGTTATMVLRDARGKKLAVRLEPDATGVLCSPELELSALRSQVEVRTVTTTGEVRYLHRDVLPRRSESASACPGAVPTSRLVFQGSATTTVSRTPLLEVDALHEQAAQVGTGGLEGTPVR